MLNVFVGNRHCENRLQQPGQTFYCMYCECPDKDGSPVPADLLVYPGKVNVAIFYWMMWIACRMYTRYSALLCVGHVVTGERPPRGVCGRDAGRAAGCPQHVWRTSHERA